MPRKKCTKDSHTIYNTWVIQLPSPMPSKNWWKVNAATSGLMVLGLSEAPTEIPIITEWTIIPNSNTYNENKTIFHQNWYKPKISTFINQLHVLLCILWSKIKIKYIIRIVYYYA
jgi:hypothetical protein